MANQLGGADVLDVEIARVNQLSRAMIDEYILWGEKIVYGEIYNTMYGDILGFVNFRIESADSCLLLIEKRKIADSLALGRSLLEHYLLLMLICRGRKYFQLQDLSALSEAAFKARFQKQEARLREQQAEGTTTCLYVKKYPRAKRHLMYVFEGLKDSEEPNFVIPIHLFYFQDFRPEVMRLKDEDYFQYYEHEAETKKILRGHQQEAISNHRHYLSYDALLQCLELNGLVNAAVVARIEAHYTFLGKFLHPTRDAARDLHHRGVVWSGRPAIGMRQEYSKAAVLLASLYVCYVISGLLNEAVGLIESAPSKYMKDAAADSLRDITARAATEFPYFWLLFNDPPLYDRFNYCIHHATDEELAEWGHYSKVPKERVTFNQHIYSHFQDTLGGWSNRRCGTYTPPLS